MKSLLAGCGNSRERQIAPGEWDELVTLDISPSCHPDIIWDLNNLPLPFNDNEFDELLFFQTLEHIGQQGDYKTFFAQFIEFWRILKPGGMFYAACPKWNSIWAWSDPGHKRIISEAMLTYLCQNEYEKQVGVTAITDYREIYKADFEIIKLFDLGREDWGFQLKAINKRRVHSCSMQQNKFVL